MKIRISSASHSPETAPEVFTVRLLIDPEDGHEGIFLGEATVTIPFDGDLTFSQIEEKAIYEARKVLG